MSTDQPAPDTPVPDTPIPDTPIPDTPGTDLPRTRPPTADSPTFGLRPPRHHVDPRCRHWWRSQVAITGAIIAAPLAVVALLVPVLRWWFGIPAIVVAALTIPLLFVAPLVRWRIHRWESTEHSVYARSGLFWQEWRAAPLSRVQTIDLDRGPLQRGFGLATISVTTASSRGAVRIAALDHELAIETVNRLTELTEANEQDAT